MIIHCDFERSLLSALQNFQVTIQPCFFHFCKVLVEKSTKIVYKYKTLENKNEPIIRNFFISILKYSMFIRKDNIQFFVNYVKNTSINNMELELLDHVNRNFYKGRFSDIFFCKHVRHSTNNISESYNSRLSTHYNKKPTVR